MEKLFYFTNLNTWELFAVFTVAFLVGFSKTGIGGVIMLAIPVLAGVFGGRDSTGIMLPMLLAGDVFAVCYYRSSVQWKNIFAPMPWALVGLGAGAAVGGFINDGYFKILMGIIVLVCIVILIYTEAKGQDFTVPHKSWFYITAGILSGFASMIGNAAGPIFSIYLLALGFKKNNFMSTNAWFFLIINLTKVPLQLFVWHNISIRALEISALMVPVITIGAVLGVYVLKKINEKFFRYMIIAMTAIAAIRLFT